MDARSPADMTCLRLSRIGILLIVAVHGLFAQPSFQTVSIKRNPSDWSERFRHPMGMRANASLLLLIQFAYAPHDNPMLGHSAPLPASQVVGGPAWINSEGYDIEARAPAAAAGTGPNQEWLMWQTLLADRFKLRLHRETRQLPVYVLTAAKNGFKLPPPKGEGCVSFPPGTTPHPIPGKVDCGYVSGPFHGYESSVLHIEGKQVHLSELIRELALILDRPIVDRTGFTGEFDLDLSFSPDDSLRGFPAISTSNDAKFPNILAALKQQLGLSLAPASGPVEVLVVDHAERPSAN
jgi:uncharacterized protein (TIGR03435 family)